MDFADAPAAVRISIVDRVSARTPRVLVVDESLPIRRKLLETLHRANIAARHVTLTTNAEEALEAFAKLHPTLVLCELVGEPDDGFAMIDEMLSIDPLAKIVLVTAEDPSSAIVRKAVRRGVFALVSKPLRDEKSRQALLDIEQEESAVVRIR